LEELNVKLVLEEYAKAIRELLVFNVEDTLKKVIAVTDAAARVTAIAKIPSLVEFRLIML
jgi:hypothetical protein